jgi:hypothetical protein
MSVSKKEKKRKKNIAGFTQKQLELLLKYCIATRNSPKISCNEFHRQYSHYSRKQSTLDLLIKAYDREVIAGPLIYANVGIEVEILDDVENHRKLLEESDNDPNIRLAYALCGGVQKSFIRFKRGASTLSFYENVIPSFYSDNNSIKEILFEEKGKLPRDPYPHGWTEKHWALYENFRFPRRKTFRDLGKELDLAWDTANKYYKEILGQCKVCTSFFPIGRTNYSFQIVIFETEYEVGVLKALKRLNHTSYLYKFDSTIILGLFLRPYPGAYQKSADRFTYLEEIGMIHRLRVSIPRNYSREVI